MAVVGLPDLWCAAMSEPMTKAEILDWIVKADHVVAHVYWTEFDDDWMDLKRDEATQVIANSLDDSDAAPYRVRLVKFGDAVVGHRTYLVFGSE